MIRWAPFNYAGQTYALDHLHPRRITFVQPATANRPMLVYAVQVIYSLHCFTRKPKDGERTDSAMHYADARETRVFDFARYELSKQLPTVIEQLIDRKCFHSGRGNFFVVELTTVAGEKAEYEIYFEASRAATKGIVNLYVQSAYVRDRQHADSRPKRKPIRFQIILHNVSTGKPIAMPK